MKRFSKGLAFLGCLIVLMCGSVSIYASGTQFASGDAVADIMNNPRFKGAVDQISWLTDRIDLVFMQVITVAAFFIISTAILRNVLAGAYVSNHKFWDKVAEAHEKSEALTLAGMKDLVKNVGNTSVSSLKDGVLAFVPNIKAFTDFDDQDIEPKAYWMKAIPQMCGCIIIGVFIYNGYYRDTASTVGAFGSEICNRVFNSVDPSSWVDKLTQTTSTPDNIFKNDGTVQGEMCHDISMAIYKSVVSNSKQDLNSELKTAFMREAETLAKSFTEQYADKTYNYTGSDSDQYMYELSGFKATLVVGGTGVETGFNEDSKGDLAFNIPMSLGSTSAYATNATQVQLSGVMKKVTRPNNTINQSSVDPVEASYSGLMNVGVVKIPIGEMHQGEYVIKTEVFQNYVQGAVRTALLASDGVDPNSISFGDISGWSGQLGGVATDVAIHINQSEPLSKLGKEFNIDPKYTGRVLGSVHVSVSYRNTDGTEFSKSIQVNIQFGGN